MNNNLNPTWNETFVLDVCSTEIHCLWVRVLDDDGGYGADNLLGTAVVPLAAMKGLADARGARGVWRAGVLASSQRRRPGTDDGLRTRGC